MRDGKRVSGAVPYGYYRKPEDKQTLYVDEASASVVRRIFQLACDGMGATAIADTLSEDKSLFLRLMRDRIILRIASVRITMTLIHGMLQQWAIF